MSRIASEFFWVGNHPGLDLINTAAVDPHGDPIDLVADWTDLVDWTQAAGLIDPDLAHQCRAATQRRGRTVLTWFCRLRSGLRTVLETGRENTAAANALDAAVAAVAVRLSYQPGQQRADRSARPERAARATTAGARNRRARRNPPRRVTGPPLQRPELCAALLRHHQERLAAMVRHGRLRKQSQGPSALPSNQTPRADHRRPRI